MKCRFFFFFFFNQSKKTVSLQSWSPGHMDRFALLWSHLTSLWSHRSILWSYPAFTAMEGTACIDLLFHMCKWALNACHLLISHFGIVLQSQCQTHVHHVPMFTTQANLLLVFDKKQFIYTGEYLTYPVYISPLCVLKTAVPLTNIPSKGVDLAFSFDVVRSILTAFDLGVTFVRC